MNQMFKTTLSVLLIAIAAQLNADTFGRTFFNARPQGVNQARWMAGQQYNMYLPDTDCINGNLQIIGEYQQTFRSRPLAEFLFFNGTDTMTFGPAGTVGTDVFARNFLLNDNFMGQVTAKPMVQNFVLDINWYLGLDEWVKGLFFRVDVPINWTRWDVKLKDVGTAIEGTTIAANKFGNPLAVASPFSSIVQAWKGEFTDAAKFPHLKEPLRRGKINGAHSKTGVADVTLQLGYNFILNECGHFGVMATLVVPTGNRPTAEFVFEPMIGNGHHVALGGGLTGAYELWNNGCDQSFSIWVEGNALTMFRAKQRRLFDLKDRIGSRYLFYKKFTGVAPLVYAGEIVFGANISALECKVKNDIYGDAAVMLDYKNGGFTFDVGYDIWGRTKDKITIVEDIAANTFGVQGNTTTDPLNLDGSLDRTQSLTDIQGNFAPALPGDQVTITKNSFDTESAEHPAAVAHKVFTHLGYTWENCDYLPFIGVGGEVEFSGIKNNALNQWGIWVKGGFTFS